jgi:guanyl-specific ribonuclease Sa
LAKADKFLRDLDDVIDPERLLYVAGVNRETPAKIRIDAAGKFSYRQTLDGDGRVPHELGLLEGVATYWVDEVHGDLAKNGRVLDAITELLQTGKTAVLPTTKPAKPPTRAALRGWVAGAELAPLPVEADRILENARRGRRAGEPELTREEAARLESLALAEYLGSGEDTPEAVRSEAAEEAVTVASDASGALPGPAPSIAVEVVWGDVTKVAADVYAVGHYESVVPQRAELALDEAVSGVRGKKDYDRRRLVITQHAQRGALHAELGDVSFFPWGDQQHAERVVAVAGMGRPGTFDVAGLRRLVNSLVIAISALPSAETVCTVLIGSGEGTLTIPEAVRGYVDGISDAADEIVASTERVFVAPVTKLVVVERDRGRAEEILEAFKKELKADSEQPRTQSVDLDLYRRLKRGAGGTVSVEESIALVADAIVKAAAAAEKSPEGRALATLITDAGPNETVRKLALERLRDEGHEPSISPRPRFRVERRSAEWRDADIPARSPSGTTAR